MADSNGHGWREHRGLRGKAVAGVAGLALVAGGLALPATTAATPAAGAVDLRVLLIGDPASPTTAAWEATLQGEGVAFTEADAAGAYGSQSVALPALASGTAGRFDGVVLATAPAAFAPGALDALSAYESSHGVRQVDGYAYPSAALGLVPAWSGDLGGTTGQLTTSGLAALPALRGPVPFATGTYGYAATVVAGAPVDPWMTDGAGRVLAAVYRHPAADAQGGVDELVLGFDYSASMLQWELLAPGLVTWVTGGVHLGLSRNYLGVDVDDTFLADSSWDSALQCTPGASEPADPACPPSARGVVQPGAPDAQMTAADVAHVVAWEQATGITLELAFNGIGACRAPSAGAESDAVCTGSATVGGTTYTDPGQVVDPTVPDAAAMVDALLAHQSSFNWVNHTWGHQFLGCTTFVPTPVTSATAGTAGTMAAGTYRYEVTTATAYGESEPSTVLTVTVADGGSATLAWPDAPNGGGPTLAQEAAAYGGGTGFWGYHVYRQDPGTTTFGLVGSVPEGTGQAAYTFVDTGGTSPGAPPTSTDAYPTATNPGIDCGGTNGSGWMPATSATPDASIAQEVGLDDAFAAANGLARYQPQALVTGEHAGLENPAMPAALALLGVTAVAADASRQPQPYAVGPSTTSPRYPSNLYYNASNWVDELDEYNTLYVAPGAATWTYQGPSSGGTPVTETGRCVATATTTCLTSPATEQTLLAQESATMLAHVLGNDPRVGFAHQSNLVGPATATVGGQTVDYGYTLLTLLDAVRNRYAAWTSVPLAQVTLATAAQALARQDAWGTVLADHPSQVTATLDGTTVTLHNGGPAAVTVPLTVPTAATSGGQPFGEAYGGSRSAWVTVPPGGTATVATAPGPVAAPTLSGIAPASGPRAGGTTVRLTGTALQGATVTFGTAGTASGVSASPDGTSLTATTPAAASAGAVPVTVTTAGGTSNALTFTYLAAPVPVVTVLFPNRGQAGQYSLVWVLGRDLAPTTGVSFGGRAAPFAGFGSSLVLALAPPVSTPGTVDVQVTTRSGGTSAPTPADRFTYMPQRWCLLVCLW